MSCFVFFRLIRDSLDAIVVSYGSMEVAILEACHETRNDIADASAPAIIWADLAKVQPIA